MVSGEVVLSEEEVVQVVRNDCGEERDVVSFAVTAAGEYPMGFLGDHSRLQVTFRAKDENVTKKFFVKMLPVHNASQREYLLSLRCFFKEIGLYQTVFPKFDETAPKMRKWRPACLFTRDEELLVLEDLTWNGYYMYPERKLMDEEHVLRALEALAAMHGSSVLFEEKSLRDGGGTINETFSEFLFEAVASGDKNHPGNAAQEAAISAQLDVVDLLPGYSPLERELIKKELPSRMRRLFFLVKPSQKFRNVLVHGDLWANNLLFSRDENGNVKDAKIVDFQLARYAPPAHDIVTFLHLTQNKKFREENHLKLLRHYYLALDACLASHGLRAPDLVTWYELLGTCDYYEELGVLTAIFFFQLILIPPELSKEFHALPEATVTDNRKMVTECFLQDSVYRERVTEAMKELIDEYIL